jgi:putative endonuclease
VAVLEFSGIGITSRFCRPIRMASPQKRFVYLLRSAKNGRPYVGVTYDVSQRLATHNSGGSLYTAPHRPWALVVTLELTTEAKALAFERYLKSGSGRAFAKRTSSSAHSEDIGNSSFRRQR